MLAEFQEVNAGVERLADNHPGFEAVAARDPQLVTTQFEFHIGPQGSVGTREQFNELGIDVYAMPADCVGKDNLVGGDGARTQEFSIELMYQAVRELSQIFGVADRGDALEAELREFLSASLSKIKMPKLFDFRPELPREANGKLYKRELRDEYAAKAAAA